MKIVINTLPNGSFSLTERAREWIQKHYPKSPYANIYSPSNVHRDSKGLVRCVETLGSDAFHNYTRLEVIDVPDDLKFEVVNIEGREVVIDSQRKWY